MSLPRHVSRQQLRRTFERVVCVNLDRRPDRWQAFCERLPTDWPFREVARRQAIDGKRCPPPPWWRQGASAWGCYRSHVRILEECLNDQVQSVLLLEDDALFLDGFADRVHRFLRHVPADWQMLYLGGQHLMVNRVPPKRINRWAYQPYNVNRTHAFALQGDMLRIVYRHLHKHDWHTGHHIDHHLGRLHQRREHRIYAPKQWLVGQATSKSNISGKTPPDRFWMASETAAAKPNRTFVAVIGLHRSGSSCLAMVLHKLGVHMGNRLGGYESTGGGEAVGLAQICERAARFPATEIQLPEGQLRRQLAAWIRARQREASQRGTIAGGKYPHLCAMGKQLTAICGDGLRVIHIDRPLVESIESLKRRSRQAQGWLRTTDDSAVAVQRWLWQAKHEFLRDTEHLTVDYDALLRDPKRQIERVVDYLPIRPTARQLAAATAHVDPRQCHVRCA